MFPAGRHVRGTHIFIQKQEAIMKYIQGIRPRGAGPLLLISQWVFICINAIEDYQGGGGPWKQGDWLINSELTDVRRGLFGSLILTTADALHFKPLLFLILLQLALLLALGYGIFKIMSLFRDNDARHLLFVLPTFLLAFWANDPQGSLRKELILFAGLALIVLGSETGKIPMVVGALLSTLAMLAHEVNLLMCPFVMYALYLGRQQLSKPMLLTLLGLLSASFLYSLQYDYAHQQVRDASLICAPLTQRALSKDICSGAIKWLTLGPTEVRHLVASRITLPDLTAFLLFFAASGALWISVAKRLLGKKVALGLFLVPAVATVPLYFVAVDWGRWMNISFTVSTFLLIAHTLRDKARVVMVNWKYLYLVAMASAVLSPLHTLGLAHPKSLRFVLPVLVIFVLHTTFSRLQATRLLAPSEPGPDTSNMQERMHQGIAPSERERRRA